VPFYFFLWDDDRIDHLAQHGVDPEDFEAIVQQPDRYGVSRTSGRPVAYGFTADGRYLKCVYEMVDEVTVSPVTAFEVRED
jgi:hypothetical protein